MKLLILTPNYPRIGKEMNGVFIHQQVKALQQLGFECHVLLLHNWYPAFKLHRAHAAWREGYVQKQSYFNTYEGVSIHHISVWVKIPDRVFKNNYHTAAADAIVKYVRKTKVLHGARWLYAHFFIDSGYIATLVKQRLNIRVAVIARGDDVHAWPNEKKELIPQIQAVIKEADVLLANSIGLSNSVKRWMGETERDVTIAYNGVDLNSFQPIATEQDRAAVLQQFGLSADMKYAICISTPVVLKGWLELLQAIRDCGEFFNGWKLLMVAPPRLNDDGLNLERIAAELSISDRVHNLGQLQHADIAQLLPACDMFVLPSYNEGMANALLEAMACGIACIATDVGGHAEVIEDRKNGILVKPKQVEGIKTAILKLIQDDGLRASLGNAARVRMIAFGNYLQNAKKLAEIFN